MPTRKYRRYNNLFFNSNKSQKNKAFLGGETQKPISEAPLSSVDFEPEEDASRQPGFFGTIKSAAGKAIENTAKYVENKGARLLGYEPIKEEEKDKMEQLNTPSELSKKTSELTSTAKNVAMVAAEKANQLGAVIIDKLNNTIDGPVKTTTMEALSRTIETIKGLLEEANKKLDDPEFVRSVAEMIEKLSNNLAIMLEAAEPALNKAIDRGSEIGEKVAKKVGESAVAVALNTINSMPGPGVLIGAIRDADKLAEAGEAIIAAGAETVTTMADTFSSAKKAIDEKMSQMSSVTDRINEAKNRISSGVDTFNKVDSLSKKMGLGSGSNDALRTASILKSTKIGGKPSRRFRKARRRLTRKLRFKLPETSSN